MLSGFKFAHAAFCGGLMLFVGACISSSDDDDDFSSALYEGDEAGECDDRADNDRDGLFDCDDDGCEGSPDCSGDDDDNVSDDDDDTTADDDDSATDDDDDTTTDDDDSAADDDDDATAIDADSDGSPQGVDCDDGNPLNFPGNTEICDAQDNDCDPNTEAGDGETDDDSDTVINCNDSDDSDPTICIDTDQDGCDDCSSGTFDPAQDGCGSSVGDATLRGEVTASVGPASGEDGVGTLYIAVFTDNPLGGGGQVVRYDQLAADFTATGASYSYEVTFIPARSQPYSVLAFLDDDGDVDTGFPVPSAVDMAAMLSFPPPVLPTLAMPASGDYVLDLTLNQNGLVH